MRRKREPNFYPVGVKKGKYLRILSVLREDPDTSIDISKPGEMIYKTCTKNTFYQLLPALDVIGHKRF